MATTYKFKGTVIIKERGITKTLHPMVEATNEAEARQILKAQFINGDVRSVTKVR